MQKKIYLASKSQGRQWLLKESEIPFELIKQEADEKMCDWGKPVKILTQSLACLKMEHVQLFEGKTNQLIWVLTADTLGVNKAGQIHGKPNDKAEAICMLHDSREGLITGTGFCIERKKWFNGAWHTNERYIGYGQAEYIFDVPDHFIDEYFKKLKELTGLNYLELSGGFSVEGYGMQFVKELHGSYSAVEGLPLYEFRQGLIKLGFFD